ncbi:hypothetical protein SEUCBS139899_010869 [Sporothrix eucalyptigena]
MPLPTTQTKQATMRRPLVSQATSSPESENAGLAQRDASPTPASVFGYSYLGCYSDNIDKMGPQLLTGASSPLPAFADPGLCAQWCLNKNKGFSYCGVENGSMCYCDFIVKSMTTNNLAQSSECSQGCAGNSNVQCGGASCINIYSATDFTDTGTQLATYIPATLSGYTYLGCVSDSTKGLLTQQTVFGTAFMDASYCCTMCLNADNGNVICGVESGSMCYCAYSTQVNGFIPAAASDCNFACAGNRAEACGGSFRLGLYKATGPDMSTTSQTIVSSATATQNDSIPTSAQAPTTSHNGVHGGAVAGVVIGVLAGIAVLAGLVYFAWVRYHRHRSVQYTSGPPQRPPSEVLGDTKHTYPSSVPVQTYDEMTSAAPDMLGISPVYELQGHDGVSSDLFNTRSQPQ